jgi:hypothetical protein
LYGIINLIGGLKLCQCGLDSDGRLFHPGRFQVTGSAGLSRESDGIPLQWALLRQRSCAWGEQQGDEQEQRE